MWCVCVCVWREEGGTEYIYFFFIVITSIIIFIETSPDLESVVSTDFEFTPLESSAGSWARTIRSIVWGEIKMEIIIKNLWIEGKKVEE